MDETTAIPRARPKLGEELPVFCEKCGYSLHGLPQQVCDQCTIRQFKCPECGHHQPINTLRPAFQKMLGRLQAAWLVMVVFFKLNFFGWLLFAWFVGGAETAYTWRYLNGNSQREVFRIDWSTLMAFMILGFLFGAVGRMLLLRWRNGSLVGAVLGGLVALMLAGGARFEQWERDLSLNPFGTDFVQLILFTALVVMLGAAVVWWAWSLAVRAFLPSRMAKTLLDWQRNLSERSVSQLAR
jgi:hypothetical protein